MRAGYFGIRRRVSGSLQAVVATRSRTIREDAHAQFGLRRSAVVFVGDNLSRWGWIRYGVQEAGRHGKCDEGATDACQFETLVHDSKMHGRIRDICCSEVSLKGTPRLTYI